MPKFNPNNGISCSEYTKEIINNQINMQKNHSVIGNINFFNSSPVYFINRHYYKSLKYKYYYMKN